MALRRALGGSRCCNATARDSAVFFLSFSSTFFSFLFVSLRFVSFRFLSFFLSFFRTCVLLDRWLQCNRTYSPIGLRTLSFACPCQPEMISRVDIDSANDRRRILDDISVTFDFVTSVSMLIKQCFYKVSIASRSIFEYTIYTVLSNFNIEQKPIEIL